MSHSATATVRCIEPIYQRRRRSAGGPVLELAVLGLLKEHELHGYEIRKRVSEILGPIARLSFGTLYPALNQLEKIGVVRVLKVTESRTGLTTARGRKIYAITPDGEQLFEELLDARESGKDDDDKAFALRLAFARYLPAEARLRLLVRRRELLSDRLAESRQALTAQGEDVDSYTRSLMEHSTEVTQNDIAWLDRLIAAEQKLPAEKAQ